jgi:hypothetical protein
MSCPWAKLEKIEPVNFDEIMSEEVARDLQAKEDKKYAEMIGTPSIADDNISEEVPVAVVSDEACESDAMIARMLQMAFDKEYDDNLRKTEEKVNGASKVSISLENFRRVPHNFGKLKISHFVICCNMLCRFRKRLGRRGSGRRVRSARLGPIRHPPKTARLDSALRVQNAKRQRRHEA